MSKVVLIRCDSYEYVEVLEAMKRGIELLGGIARYAKKGEKILLKPNVLFGEAPEKCSCTHPVIVKAAGELFLSAGAVVSYGDSPGFGSTMFSLKKAGYIEFCPGLIPVEFGTGKEVFYDKGVQNKKLVIADPVLESDGVISLPKLKTHAFQKYTGCIKNQFGCVPGTLKAEYHVKLPDAMDFSRMLVDIDGFVKPRLYIMDGINAMEGNGPRGGNPVAMKVILLSEDPVALDATACRLIDLDPSLVPVITEGQKAGRGVWREDFIELAGNGIDEFLKKDFDVDRNSIKTYKKSGVVKFLSNRFVPKPVINPARCTQCGVCVNICPVKPKSLSFEVNETYPEGDRSRPPVYDYSVCIRCYCCQEMCPEKAISLKRPFIRKIFG